MGRIAITRSVDEKTKERLKELGKATKRGEGYVIDWLVDQAFSQLFPQTNKEPQGPKN